MLPAFFAVASASAVYDYVIVGGGTAYAPLYLSC